MFLKPNTEIYVNNLCIIRSKTISNTKENCQQMKL